MLGQKRNDSLFGPGSRTIEAPQSVLEKQEAALEGSPLDEAVQPPFETQAPATAFTDADDLPRRTIATEAAAGQRVHSLFFTPESESKDFSSVLQDVQEYISGKYSTLITDGVGADTKEQIKRYDDEALKDPTQKPDGTPVEGKPDAEDHDTVEPPPPPPSTNTSGGLPGFDTLLSFQAPA